MKILSSLAAASLCVAAVAQSPLVVLPVAPVGYYGWNTPATSHQNFFNLTVTSQVTLQAIATPLLAPVGQIGQLEVYLTNPGITTYVGSETNAANWTLASSGIIIGNGTAGAIATVLTRTSCQSAGGSGLVLNPGTYGVALRYVGVSPLLVGVGVPQTFTNAELSVSGGAIQYTAWGAVQAPIGGTSGLTAWGWRGSLIYQNGNFPHACAEATTYGTGCYTSSGSFYQEFTDSSTPSAAGAASAAMTGRTLSLLPAGNGYVLVQGTGVNFVAPTATATTLALADNAEQQITLPIPFTYPGGIATDLFVHSNGYVSVASNTTLPNGFNNIPDPKVMLAAPATAWWSWHDYDPSEAGSGQVSWDQVGNLLLITWNGVESKPATAVNPSTWQFQFDVSTGQVNYVWQTIDAVGGSGFLEGDDHVVGFSPGGASPDVGATNITTVTSQVLNFPEVFPLTLATSAKPLIGTTISLDTTNQSIPSVGINFVSTGQFAAPGIDLGVIGAAGCAALVDINAGVGNVISDLGLPGTSMSVSFPLPNNPVFAGLSIYSQSIWLDASANAFGAISSNALTLLLGNF